MIKPTIVLPSLALLSVGCASTDESQRTASLLAAYTQRLQTRIETFAKHRESVAESRTRVISVFERSTTRLSIGTDRLMRAAELSGMKDRVALYTSVIEAANGLSEQEAAAARREAELDSEIANAKSRVTVNSRQLSAAAKALAQLGKKADTSSTLKFYGRFLLETFKKTTEAMEKAEAKAKARGEYSEIVPGRVEAEVRKEER